MVGFKVTEVAAVEAAALGAFVRYVVGAGVGCLERLELGADKVGVEVGVADGAKAGAEDVVSVGLSEGDVEGVVVGDEVGNV